MYKDVQYIGYIFPNNENNPNIQQGIIKINCSVYLVECYVVNFLKNVFNGYIMTCSILTFKKICSSKKDQKETFNCK